ncbi:HTH domain-containing protein [Candidatus Woesearchaeota archaeon]|jgi:predicted transcriptional regulator|nr:HTH domain-containing protein [Candidatus Woesearchaeota archaeon]MBT5271803.1 HTH domain-containing protein [Candidatus Woesearchaeota archaeon]MBT6040678.1 HTH domain-containing protein [Candidatus Woesearchaeota archaeon]MBT6336439.1 HTH domain-containing protein [Candidatus Woesearchaeota archaeon]MBT7926781.1 HTH domain-containing protein [Candidatus Woesearchaeota archaeon]
MPTKITIIRVRKPVQGNINHELQWLGSSLGLFGLRDKDKSCFRLFIELIKSTKKGKALSSDDLANKLHLSRGTVVHHLHKLQNSGIIVSENKGYLLRVNRLKNLILEIEKDMKRTLDDMKEMADEIDKKLGGN